MVSSVKIGMMECRLITSAIKDSCGIDFTEYSTTSLIRRLEKFGINHAINSVDEFIYKIKTTPEIKNRLLYEIPVPATEMFRDPGIWRWIRDELAPMIKQKNIFNVFVPECICGDELYTLCIVFNEACVSHRVIITASSVAEVTFQDINSGKTSSAKMAVGSENYKRYNGQHSFEMYFKQHENEILRDSALIMPVNFVKLSLSDDVLPTGMDMVLFRNRFIYYNQHLQDTITERLVKSLRSGGFLILGAKEKPGRQFAELLTPLQETEGVFTKK
jgi:chemotaxis protein methyltransferase CheR